MRNTWFAATLVVALVSSFAYGQGASQPKMATINSPPEKSKIIIGNMGLATTVLPFVAMKEGYFKDEGIEIELQMSGGGAEILPAAQAGKIDIAYTGVVSPILANGEGANFKFLLASGRFDKGPPDGLPLMVLNDSPIKSAKDLSGKRIAINNLGSLLHIFLREYLDMNKVDPKSVTFVELPFPTMVDPLLNKQIDVAATVEPFRTIMLRTGKIRELDSYFTRINPGFNLAGWVATDKWLRENPVTALRFIRAMKKANDLVLASNDKEISYIAKWTKMDPNLVRELRLESWEYRIDLPSLQKTIDVVAKQGFLKKPLRAPDMIWYGAPLLK